MTNYGWVVAVDVETVFRLLVAVDWTYVEAISSNGAVVLAVVSTDIKAVCRNDAVVWGMDAEDEAACSTSIGDEGDLTGDLTLATSGITDLADQLTSATPPITNFQSPYSKMSQNTPKVQRTLDHQLPHPLDNQPPKTFHINLYHDKDEDALFERTAVSPANQFYPNLK
uniref:Uncharacterized protein n=1 Tax=Romanomermis culicivorax TaxID=13658 RepID=A0A915KL71_ROMCU